jgi:hypothetical protein
MFRNMELAGHRDGVKAVVWEAWIDGSGAGMGSAWLGTRRKEDGDASNDRRW